MIDFGQIVFKRVDDGRTITIDMPGDITIDDLLDEFTSFLRACGYYVPPHSYLDFVNEAGEVVNQEADDHQEPLIGGVPFGWDKTRQDRCLGVPPAGGAKYDLARPEHGGSAHDIDNDSPDGC